MTNKHSSFKYYNALSIINGTPGDDVFPGSPYPDDFIGVGFDTVDYSNSPLSVFVDSREERGYGPGYSQNDTYVGIGRFILSDQDDVFITKMPTDVIQVTYLDTNRNPFSVPTLDGSIIIAWQCTSGSATEICAAKYDKDNNRVLSQRVINTNTAGIQNFPKGALLRDGRLLFSWEGGNGNAKAKVFFSDLSTSVDEFFITPVGANIQLGISAPIILNDGRALFFIEYVAPLSRIGINGTVLDVDTQARTGFPVNSVNSIGYQQGPYACALQDGGFITVWYGNVQGNSFFNILMRRYDNNITTAGTEMVLTADGSGAQIPPFVGDQRFPTAAVNNGRFCVVWECSLQGRSLTDVCLNVYDLNLLLIKTFTPLNENTPKGNNNPYVVPLSIGGFRTAWKSTAQGSTFSTMITLLLDGNASKVGGESRVNVNSDSLSNNVLWISASSLNGHGSIVSWPGSNNIFYRTYNSRIVVEARGGNDSIIASGGMGDILNCGSGLGDNVSYAAALSPCTIDLTAGKGCGDDLISECENIITSQFGDTITCNGNNIIYGGAGNDVINIMGLPVTVYGNGGVNEVSFVSYNRPITLDLNKGAGNDGISNVTLYNISTIRCSNNGDYIASGYNNTIYGGNGDDTMVVILPAIVYGGSGMDTISFELSAKAVTFDLTANTGTDGINTITSSSIENVICSPLGDTITGNALDNVFYPGASRDKLDGMGSSNDKVSYEHSPKGVVVNLRTGRGSDNDASGSYARDDTYSNIENIVGSSYDDKLLGANIDNSVIEGRDGDDWLSPGDGSNTVLKGGAGVDTFKIGTLKGSAIISDFEINNGEKIDLTGFTSIYSIKDLKMKQDVNSNGTIITINDGSEITLENVLMTSLTPEHFDFAPYPPHVSSINPAWIAFGITATCALLSGALTGYRWYMSRAQMQVTKMQAEIAQLELSKVGASEVKPAGSMAALPDTDATEEELA
jgi:hypothetical protein